jgi:molybdopterin-synthase adenylyltransferase
MSDRTMTETERLLEARYARQLALAELGREGQRRLMTGSVLIVGCGALGSHLAEALARAGVGRLRVVDRDVVELHNLQRQALFDEQDVAARLPKAEATARRLRRINSTITVDARVLDLNPRNVEELIADVEVVLDGSDNLETRYLLNDACVKHGRPWVYGGVIGAAGMMLTLRPGAGPCLRCVFRDPPPPGSQPTCETVGVLGMAPAVIAALQAVEACKLLVAAPAATDLLHLDLWSGSWQRVAVHRDPACPACGHARFDYLSARETAWVTTLCGRNAIQIMPAREAAIDLDRLAAQLAPLGAVATGLLLQVNAEDCEMLVFPDGRVIIRGTTDPALARSLYARYIGS